jgi:hypothetical protein
MERIEIKHFDLEFEKNIQTTEAFIELHDTYFRYVSIHDSEVPKDKDDVNMGWEEKYHDFDIRVKRENIVSVEKYWNDKHNFWQLELEANGYPNTVNLYFEKNNEVLMKEAFDKLCKWIF